MTAARAAIASFPHAEPLEDDTLHYGPGAATEQELRLLGPLEGKRALLLGTAGGHASVTLARAGARVTAIEPSPTVLDAARRAHRDAELHVEVHHGDYAELAKVRAGTIDVSLSVFALAAVEDLGRVFRQVQRVLRPGGAFVISLPHPDWAMVAGSPSGTEVVRAYHETSPRRWEAAGVRGVDHTHTIAAVVTALVRANFRIDTLLELVATNDAGCYRAPAIERVPSTLVIRSRPLAG
ncbi:MAG: class I SAM-dependent methyltransferase [Actinomycetota bacterium]|nr:class I SAM-dependent methyltransferase [Actinomycetota bacterium]